MKNKFKIYFWLTVVCLITIPIAIALSINNYRASHSYIGEWMVGNCLDNWKLEISSYHMATLYYVEYSYTDLNAPPINIPKDYFTWELVDGNIILTDDSVFKSKCIKDTPIIGTITKDGRVIYFKGDGNPWYYTFGRITKNHDFL